MLKVDLMIILFPLKLDKFYSIGVMNQLNSNFFVHKKMSHESYKNEFCNRQELNILMVVVKKMLLITIL